MTCGFVHRRIEKTKELKNSLDSLKKLQYNLILHNNGYLYAVPLPDWVIIANPGDKSKQFLRSLTAFAVRGPFVK